MRIFLKIASITGDAILKGVEGQIELQSFQFEAIAPTDPSSGLPTGAVRAKRLVATKNWDKASPPLARALVQNTALGTVTFTFLQEVGTNAGKKPWVIDAQNAKVAGINEEATGGGATPVEQVQFDFGSLTFRFTFGGTTSTSTLAVTSGA